MAPFMAIADQERQAAYWEDQADQARALALFGAEARFRAQARLHRAKAEKLSKLRRVVAAQV